LKKFSDPRFDEYIKIKKEGNHIILSCDSTRKKSKSLFGSTVSGIKRMFAGVSHGYTYKMKIFSVHFPMNITIKDNNVLIKNFLGEKTLRIAKIRGKASVKVDKDELIVTGTDKEEVGQTCGNIEKAVKISKKDHRIFQDGIYLEKKSVGM